MIVGTYWIALNTIEDGPLGEDAAHGANGSALAVSARIGCADQDNWSCLLSQMPSQPPHRFTVATNPTEVMKHRGLSKEFL